MINDRSNCRKIAGMILKKKHIISPILEDGDEVLLPTDAFSLVVMTILEDGDEALVCMSSTFVALLDCTWLWRCCRAKREKA